MSKTEDRQREIERLREQLSKEVAVFDAGGGKLSDVEHLTIEALTYAKIGDLDEAKHRLRLRDWPKFHSVSQCRAAYAAAMQENVRGSVQQ